MHERNRTKGQQHKAENMMGEDIKWHVLSLTSNLSNLATSRRGCSSASAELFSSPKKNHSTSLMKGCSKMFLYILAFKHLEKVETNPKNMEENYTINLRF